VQEKIKIPLTGNARDQYLLTYEYRLLEAFAAAGGSPPVTTLLLGFFTPGERRKYVTRLL
jgi:hypothetical protein